MRSSMIWSLCSVPPAATPFGYVFMSIVLVQQDVAGHDVPSLLQWRLAANKRARGSLDASLDPAQAQSLNDERMAIMLQNQEFLKWLRHDQDFMLTLRNGKNDRVCSLPFLYIICPFRWQT